MPIQTVTTDTLMDSVKPQAPVAVTTGEETISTAPDPSGGEPTAAQVEKAKAGTEPGVQKRIDSLTREKKEMEEAFEAEYIARLAAEQKLRDALKEKPVEAAPVIEPEKPKRPRLQDYETAEKYDTAMDAYETAQKEQAKAEARKEAQEQLAVERRNQIMQMKVEAAEQEFPDFREVIDAASTNLKVPGAVQAFMEESDLTAIIAYTLAKDVAERDRIFQLSPVRAVAELGKLEEKLLKRKKPEVGDEPAPQRTAPPVRTTRAPAPISQVREGTGVVAEEAAKSQDFQEYKARRKAELRAKH